MGRTTINNVFAREILDSRGNPTVEAVVELCDGSIGVGISPSGASTGKREALELRDNDKERFCKKGVTKAVGNINGTISQKLKGIDASDTYMVDRTMIQLDGTKDKHNLGANAILAVSIAAARAASCSIGIPLFRFIGGTSANIMPVPMMNIINGGAHARNNLDIQEYMIMPIGAEKFSEALRWCSEVYHTLAKIISDKGMSTAVGDEGGFAPDFSSDTEAIEFIIEAIEKSGYKLGTEFALALDAASSEWKSDKSGGYFLHKSNRQLSTDELISYWKKLCDDYPIVSIEDGLGEDDWDGWKRLTAALGDKIQLVGDDLFVTNTEILTKGIEEKCANSILIKPNQIGTLSETMEAIKLAKRNGYTSIVSHRSGESEDTLIADLSVALNAGQIKSGAPCRTERTSKYNQLLRIESGLGLSARYYGLMR
ncbi:MAG: phosphopyruvate hydratase [Oscillospiraceae bacterium]|nr:phosphopyruvate hydratase [Oscillospiraceae bacterium]